MAKLKSNPIPWNRALTYTANLANAINNYWGIDAVRVVNDTLETNMVAGVPEIFYRVRHRHHPDVVWMYRDSYDGRIKVRR